MGITINRSGTSTVEFAQPQEVVINHADDSIRIGNGASLVSATTVGAKVGLDVNVLNALELAIESDEDSISTESIRYAVRIDEASATITYIGEATPGTAEGAASWRVKRITTSGANVIIEWAGSADFGHIWNNRASLTYT